MSAPRKARGGVSFTVVDGGRAPHRQPLVPREEPRAPLAVTVYAVAVAWFACIGFAWSAYAICKMTGVVR